MRALYLDCFSGISGDMTVGALCDLGVKPSALEWELSKLAIGDFHIHVDRAQRKNVEGVKFNIHAGASGEECHHGETHAHSHACADDEEHDHRHEHEREHVHHQRHEDIHAHEHGDEHTHGHGHEAHEQEHQPTHSHSAHEGVEHSHGRSHHEIRALLEASALSPFVKGHALGIFARIAAAEGKIHGMPAADVHFHEVGALDSIADIVCACVGIETLE